MKRWTLSRYLGQQYLMWFIAFMAGLAGVIYLFEVAELLRRATDRPETTFGLILRMGLYKMPDTIERILPFVVLFSGMFTFWRLTRSHELVIARAAGVSAWQFLTPALLLALGTGLFFITVYNPVASAMLTRF